VLAANVASRNIENCKEASRNKGQLSIELPDHEASDILDATLTGVCPQFCEGCDSRTGDPNPR
jgi:hypothetical protein